MFGDMRKCLLNRMSMLDGGSVTVFKETCPNKIEAAKAEPPENASRSHVQTFHLPN